MAETLENPPSAAATSATSPDAAPLAAIRELRSGDRIGRFVVVRRIGGGGGGVVYEARDDALGRSVAVKVLREGGDPAWSRRLLREARAAASLPHPNVVAIHEVGVHELGPYIAMELVDGVDARAWRSQRPRTWREIVDVYAQAGRGLAAAHAAGLVHRDVKPDNILVGRHGARIGDFGLARPVGAEPEAGLPADGGGDEQVTRTGHIVGTPRYMAPEQRGGGAPDARSDQFSFCVALHEALAGTPPGAERDGGRAVDARLPARARRALARGLRTAPDERWPSVDALLRALTRDPWRTWGRVAVVAVVAGAVAVAIWGRATRAPRCSAGEDRFQAVWNPQRRAALEAAFVATGRINARDRLARVADALDRYGKDWSVARLGACEATERGQQPQAVMDRRTRCLDRELAEVDLVIDGLQHGGADAHDSAVDAIAVTTRDLCANAAALAPKVPLPADPAARARIEALEGKLARVAALRLTIQYRAAAEMARPLVAEARGLGYAPLYAQALSELAMSQGAKGDPAEAEANVRELARVAAEAHDDALVARAWMILIKQLMARGRRDAALALVAAAEAAIARAGDDPLLHARLAIAIANIHLDDGDLDAARGDYERAARLYEEHAPGSPDLANALEQLGVVLADSGAGKQAAAVLLRALEIRSVTHGPDDFNAAYIRSDLGRLYVDQGRFPEAQYELEHALATLRRELRPDHPRIVYVLQGLALLHLGQGDPDAAARDVDEALAIRRKSSPGNAAAVAYVQPYAGLVALARRRPDEALATCRAAAELLDGSRRSIEQLVLALRCQGEALVALGRPGEAIPVLERALDTASKDRALGHEVVHIEHDLADALWAARRDRPRALALARTALAAAEGDERRAIEADLERWQRAR